MTNPRRIPAWTALLITLALLPAAAGAEVDAADYQVTDAPGDHALLRGTGPAVPASPASAHADLVELRIENEDELGLDLVYRLSTLHVSPGAFVCCSEQLYFNTQFRIGTNTAVYEIDTYVGGEYSSADATSLYQASYWSSELCLRESEDAPCFSQPVESYLEPGTDEIRLRIAKEALLGNLESHGFGFQTTEQRPPGLPRVILPGDQITGLVAEVQFMPAFILIPLELYDRIPDTGEAPAYTFQSAVANQVLRVELGSTNGLPVAAGTNQTLQLRVENQAAGKRLVGLEYTLTGPEEALGNYKVWGPATVTIPGGQTRPFTYALDVKPGASAADGVVLEVRAINRVDPAEIGLAAARLLPGATLGPGSNELHVHGLRYQYTGTEVDNPMCEIPLMVCSYGFLSPLADHPDATPGAPLPGFMAFYDDPGYQWYLYADTATPVPLAFDRDQPIQLDLNLAGRAVPGDARVTATLVYHTEETSDVLFEETTTGTVTPGGSVHTLTGPARFNTEPGQRAVLPAGTAFQLNVRVEYPAGSTGTADWALGGAKLLPEDSKVVLPLAELPDDLKRGPLDVPIQLAAAGSTEDFVNPGEARLYNVSVLNQAGERLRVRVDAVAEPAGWTVEVLPGSVFELESGDTITLGVLAHADANASEGDIGVIRLNATVPGHDAIAGPTLRAIVTKFDLPDDAPSYRASEDDAAKVVEHEANGTPGPGALLGLLGAGAAAAVASRRRRGRAL